MISQVTNHYTDSTTPRRQWKNTHLKGASMVTQCLWRVIVCGISQQTTGVFYPSLSTLQKIMIFFHLNCGLGKRGRTKLSLMPPWVKWFLNKELVAVSQWCQASQGSTPHRWATCPPTPAFNSSIYKLNPGHKFEGLKKFYPNTTGLSKGSKLALQLVWFPFYAPFWKVGFHFAFLYRALSCSIPVLLRIGSCLALARSRAQLTHHDTYLEGGRECLVPKRRSLSGSLQGHLRLPASLTFWEVQFSPGILVYTGLFLKLFFFF